MEVYRGQVMGFHKVGELRGKGMRVNRFPVPTCENKVILHNLSVFDLYGLRPLVTDLEPLCFLNTPPFLQQFDAVRTNTEIAVAFPCFGCAEYRTLSGDDLQITVDRYNAVVEVYITPPQPGQFSASAPSQQGKLHHR